MASWSEIDHKTAIGPAGAAQITTLVGTSADIICVAATGYGGASQVAGDMTSSPANTWLMTTVQVAGGDGSLRTSWYYCISPSVSGAMTITWSPSALAFNCIHAYSLTQSSAPTFNTSTATGTNSSGSVNIPSIGNANDLALAFLGYYTAAGPTISDGGGAWSSVVDVAYSGGNNIGLATAWKQISGAVSPVWTTNSSNVVAAEAMAVTGTGGGGGGTNWGAFVAGTGFEWNRLVVPE